MLQSVRFSLSVSEQVLRLCFRLLIVWRVLYPFYNNPLDWRHSDPGRHWENGINFLHPYIFGSIDPKLYQAWVWLLAQLADGDQNRGVIALMTGLLCAAMPLVWYRVARELFDRKASLCFGIAVALCPSFVPIFKFFMNETLLIVLIGAGFWLTLRAVRKETFSAFALAMFIWVLASFTRMVALPFAAMSFAYMLYHQPRKLAPIALTIVLYVGLAIPASYHSDYRLNTIAPFQFTWLNKIYYKNGSVHYRFYSDLGVWQFASPSFFSNPLEPLVNFTSYRNADMEHPYIYKLDTKNGAEDWEKAYQDAAARYTPKEHMRNWFENTVFFLFSPSWPDYNPNAPADDWTYINYITRWVWAPLIVGLFLLAPVTRNGEKRNFILFSTWAVIFLFLIQQHGVMEGRYRKPIEPLLMLAAMFALIPDKHKRVPLVQTVWRVFIAPYIGGILKTLYFLKGLKRIAK